MSVSLLVFVIFYSECSFSFQSLVQMDNEVSRIFSQEVTLPASGFAQSKIFITRLWSAYSVTIPWSSERRRLLRNDRGIHKSDKNYLTHWKTEVRSRGKWGSTVRKKGGGGDRESWCHCFVLFIAASLVNKTLFRKHELQESIINKPTGKG